MRILETFNLSFVQMLNEHPSFKPIYIIYTYKDECWTANWEPYYKYVRDKGQYYNTRDIQKLIKR